MGLRLIHSPRSAHSNPKDSVGYAEHRVGLAEEGQAEIVWPGVKDIPVKVGNRNLVSDPRMSQIKSESK